jgi:hypothetical protein
VPILTFSRPECQHDRRYFPIDFQIIKEEEEEEEEKEKSGLTCMESCVLLDVTELLETSIAIGATIRFFTRVDADVLHQLVVGRKRFETLLTLVRLRFTPVGVTGVHLHRRFGHENLSK